MQNMTKARDLRPGTRFIRRADGAVWVVRSATPDTDGTIRVICHYEQTQAPDVFWTPAGTEFRIA